MQNETYYAFLDRIHNHPLGKLETYDWQSEIENGHYFKFQKETRPGCYVLDYTKQTYCHINDKMAEFANSTPIPDLQSGGLKLALELWHPDDLAVYNAHILPDTLNFLKGKKQKEYSEYLYRCNYRVKNKRRGYIHIEQTSFFNDFSRDGSPLLAIGYLRDITNNVTDNSILHTIEHINTLGSQPVFQKRHWPDKRPLAPRELNVLELIITGKRNDEIALVLDISKNTVEEYRKNILKRTGCRTMEQVVAHALRQGWVK